MKDLVKEQINMLFSLLAESVNNSEKDYSMLFYYRFIGSVDILYYQELITGKEHIFLSNAAWEVYFNDNNKIFTK